jgi:hypothetical protein
MKRTLFLLTLIVLCALAFHAEAYGQSGGFTDDFNDNARDTAKWTIATMHDTNFNSQVQVAEQSQQLQITTPANVLGYSGYVTASTKDFTNSRTSVEVVQTVGLGNDTVFALGIDSNNRYRFVVENGNLYFQYKAGGGASNSTSVTYNATQHRFWRFRHDTSLDQIIFETSADGTTWTTQRAVARQFANTAIKVELSSGSWALRSTATTAIFDNFRLEANNAPPPSSDDPILPQQTVNTTYPTNTAPPINVPSGGNLQAAIDAASPGDTITLQPGATYLAPEGGFRLRNKGASTSWIIIRSASTAFDSNGSIPPGTRVDGTNTAHTSQMPKILSQVTNSPAIAADPSAHHYRLVGLEAGMTSNVVSSDATIQLGTGGETSTALMPSFITVDRCYVHGNNVSAGAYRRGISLQGISEAVIESYVSNYHDSSDAQAIWGSNGAGPFKIYNNFLEASGENILFGGQDPAIVNMVPADIEVKRNLLSKPSSWRGVAGITTKNLFELKTARRVLVDGNIFENFWSGQGQDYAILIKSTNQDGGCSWCVSEHVTFSNNIVRHVANAVDILATERRNQTDPSPIPVNHVKIYNTLIYDVSSTWGPNYGRIFQIRSGVSYVKIMHVTAEGRYKLLGSDGPSDVNPNLTFQDNIAERGSYGINASGEGTTSLNYNYAPATYAKNLLVNTSDEPGPEMDQATTDTSLLSRYPNPAPSPNTAVSGDTFVATTWNDVGLVNRATENYRLASTSPYKNKATDGKDLGADQDAIEAAIGSSSSGSSSVLMSDDFNDNVRDTIKWTVGTMHDTSFNSQVQVAEQGQQLQITTPANILGYSGYVTANTWDFTNARTSVEVVQTVGLGNDTVFALGIDSNNRYRFVVENGNLYFQYKVNGGASNSTSVAYSATQHRFWRFRHDPVLDQVVFETSADGLNWTTQRSVARQFANTAVKIELDSGSWAARSSATTAIFDNFKLEH